jgi:diaminopimelate epimerase
MNSSGSSISFVKASACGNDFLIVESAKAPEDLVAFSRRICDRHEGVGADGVELLYPAEDADVHARLFNADGSEAEISGNGTRCVAAYICSTRGNETIVVRTGAGLKTCTLISRHDTRYDFEIAMGEPQVGEELQILMAHHTVWGIPVSMGNPHYVVFVSKFADAWQTEAAEIGQDANFEHGVNVELVKIENEGAIDVRFFERGVGETQSSGTGSCAAAVAAIAAKKARSPLRVNTPGGVQTVRWDGEVFLRGPAWIVCRGEFFA